MALSHRARRPDAGYDDDQISPLPRYQVVTMTERIPSTQPPINVRRADRGASAAASYAAATRFYEATLEGDELQDVVSDLIGDLCHLLDARGIHAAAILERARATWLVERSCVGCSNLFDEHDEANSDDLEPICRACALADLGD